MSKATAIQAVSKATEVAITSTDSALPDFLQGAELAGAGLEGIDARDLQMPLFRLRQNESMKTDKKQATGEIFHSLSQEVIGTDEIPGVFVPIDFRKERVMFQEKGATAQSKWLCRSRDGKTAESEGGRDKDGKPTGNCGACVLKDFSPNAKDPRPPCKENILVPGFAIVPSARLIGALRFGGTSNRVGKELMSMAAFRTDPRGRQLPLFSTKYLIGSKRLENAEKQVYYRFTAQPGAFVDEETFTFARNLYAQWKGKRLDVELGDEDREASPGTAGTDGPVSTADGAVENF
jgi:hypothetical protein